MKKHQVGSEAGRLRSVMLHRPHLSLKRLTPSDCQELLFDDVLVPGNGTVMIGMSGRPLRY
ncbi:hypothetical protein [Erwinia tasmaniensis]|uniref:hypothetical protein n=1 Tax=Erwinia tasmaniensis TaxID=338565 RepID=UPI003A4DF491